MSLDWLDLAKVVVPALGGWLAIWASNRKEQRQWQAKQEVENQKAMSSQADRLSAGWAEMTAQAREIINTLQVETIAAKTRAVAAEERADRLERELAETRSLYDTARRDLEKLRERGRRKTTVERE